MIADVIVVGAGPAAVATALICVDAGLTTTLVAKCPRYEAGSSNQVKAIQSLHPGVESLLWDLDAIHALSRSSVATYQTMTMDKTPQPLSTYTYQHLRGHHINRHQFDEEMLNRARARGVDIRLGHTVADLVNEGGRTVGITLQNGEILRARWFIDGSGRSRAVAKHLQIAQRFYSLPLVVQTGVLKQVEARGYPRATQFIPVPNGWLWLTPTIDGFFTWTALSQRETRHMAGIHDLIIRSERGSVLVADASWRLSRPLIAPGVLLVGEAAGHLDPAWGQGVLNALKSGIMAGKAVIQGARNPALESWYHACYDEWFEHEFERGAANLKWAYDVQKIDLGFHKASARWS
jgi:flavin-dependent dehydrogenase